MRNRLMVWLMGLGSLGACDREETGVPSGSSAVTGLIDEIPTSLLDPQHVCLADVDGDGLIDLVVGGEAELEIHRGAPGGGFEAPFSLSLPYYPLTSLAAADVNGDARADLIGTFDGYVYVSTDGGVAWEYMGAASVVRAADVDGGGKNEIVGFIPANGTVEVLHPWVESYSSSVLSQAYSGSLLYEAVLVPMSYEPAAEYALIPDHELVLGDLDGDGDPDALFLDRAGSILVSFRNDGGIFLQVGAVPLLGSDLHLIAGDLDGDGDAEMIVVPEGQPGAAREILGLDLSSRSRALPFRPRWIGDIDADGLPDLIGTRAGEPGALLWSLGRGDGTFGPEESLALSGGAAGLDARDIDGDGIPEIAVGATRANPGSIALVRFRRP